MLLRFLNVQGIAGIAVGLALAILLIAQKGETRHWKKQSDQFEQLYSADKAAFAETVAGYRAAAGAARAADQVNAARVAADQRAINERTAHDFETRLAAARAHADELRIPAAGSAPDSGAGGAAPVPGLSAASARAAQAAGQNGFSSADALTATEQAIQLDELIKWVRAQAKVDNNRPDVATSRGD